MVEFCFVYSIRLKDLEYLEKTTLEFAGAFSSFLRGKEFEEMERGALDPGKRILKKKIFENKQQPKTEEIHILKIYPSVFCSCKKEYQHMPSSKEFENDRKEYYKKTADYLLSYSKKSTGNFWRKIRRIIRNKKYSKSFSYKQRDYFIFYLSADEEENYQELLEFLEKEFTPHSLHTFESYGLCVGISDIFSIIKSERESTSRSIDLTSLHTKNYVFLRFILDDLIRHISRYTDVTLGKSSEKKFLKICSLFDSILNPISLYVRKMPQNRHYEEIFDVCGILEGFDYTMNNVKVFTNLHLQKRIKRLTWVIIALTILMVVLIVIQIFGNKVVIETINSLFEFFREKFNEFLS